MKKMIFINFKTYKEGTGEEALKLAEICQEVSEKENAEIVLVAQTADIFRLTQTVSLPIWAQHLDNINFGPNTGSVLPEAVLAAGAKGTVLNHSENKLPFQIIEETIKKVKRIGMKVLVCCESVDEGKRIAKAKPDFLSYEPSEFIGRKDISVATAKPEVITNFAKEFPGTPLIVGAGIHSRKDVEISLQLGAQGILVATDVVLAKDPKKELEKLARGLSL